VVVVGREMRDNFAKRGPDRFKESGNFIVPKSAIEAIDTQGGPDKEDGGKDERLLWRDPFQLISQKTYPRVPCVFQSVRKFDAIGHLPTGPGFISYGLDSCYTLTFPP
jgi:hypothetical protein